MSEPTYRIAQALHERRAAVGLPKYGQHLTADSPGCMIVHAIEEAADLTEYLLAEAGRRREAIKTLCDLIHGGTLPEHEIDTVADISHVIDLLGGEAALARYDEILGTVAENATVAPDSLDELEAAREEVRRQASVISELRQELRQLFEQQHHTKLLGAAEELERLADSTNELREMYLTEEFYGLRAFSPMLLSNSMKQRAAKLRQEAK